MVIIAAFAYFRGMRCAGVYITFLLFILSSEITAQESGVNAMVSLSYSGLNQQLRYHYELNKWEVELGPKLNYSKSRSLITNSPGLSLQINHQADMRGQYFLLYEWLPQKVRDGRSQIHEVYAGYGFQWNITNQLQVQSGIGVGLYKETGNILIKYSLQGMSYCTNIGLTYQF